MKLNWRKRSCSQQPWHEDLYKSGNRIIRVSLSFGSNRTPSTFNSTVKPIKNILDAFSKNESFESDVSDMRPWYRFNGMIEEIEGYISVKSDLSDDDLLKEIKQGFGQLTRISKYSKFRILKGKPEFMPIPRRGLFPFQWDTVRKRPDEY